MTLTTNLTNNEKRVLLALSRKDKFSPEDLAAASELSIEASMQSAFFWLKKAYARYRKPSPRYTNSQKKGKVCADITS